LYSDAIGMGLVFDDPHVIFRKDRIVTGEQRSRISHGE